MDTLLLGRNLYISEYSEWFMCIIYFMLIKKNFIDKYKNLEMKL